MADEIEKASFKVYKSDLIDRGCNAEIKSFYDYEHAPSQAMLTNPPFQECAKDQGWIRHALEVLKLEYMALLLPLNWAASGKERAKLWKNNAPSRVYVMQWRIDFTGKKAPPSNHAWYVWDKNFTGETQFKTLDK